MPSLCCKIQKKESNLQIFRHSSPLKGRKVWFKNTGSFKRGCKSDVQVIISLDYLINATNAQQYTFNSQFIRFRKDRKILKCKKSAGEFTGSKNSMVKKDQADQLCLKKRPQANVWRGLVAYWRTQWRRRHWGQEFGSFKSTSLLFQRSRLCLVWERCRELLPSWLHCTY